MSLSIPVIYGSVRRDRQGIRAARYLVAQLTARGHAPVLVDPEQDELPLLDRMYKEYKGDAPPVLERLATLFRQADAFVLVVGEYNNSIPPALSNLLDHFLEEYFWRTSGIACYSAGQFGGVRAAMQMRMMAAELGMPSIPSLLPFPRVSQLLGEDGTLQDATFQRQADRFLGELAWYGQALKAARAAGVPY
jgi:NAD(P)H-dependent FMN reductase